MNYPHIMIDLETLGVQQRSVIVSAGVALFDPFGTEIIDTHSIYFNVDEQLQLGKKVDSSTLRFWLGQDDSPRQSLVDAMKKGSKSDLQSQCLALNHLVHRAWGHDENANGLVWAHGANEDIAWLSNMYDMLSVSRPWNMGSNGYRNYGCYRTVLKLLGHPDMEFYKPEKAHDPVSDAVAQAKTLQAMLREFKRINPVLAQRFVTNLEG